MNDIEKNAVFKSMPLFADCSEDVIREIAKDSILKEYKKGEIVQNTTASTQRISVLANRGRIKISTTNDEAEELILYFLLFGDIFNVITLLDKVKDNLTAVALDDVSVFHCNIEIARTWIDNYNEFNKHLLKYVSGRLKLAQEFNIQKTFYSIELRLAKLIFNNIKDDDDQHNLINNLSHDEIAKMLGTSRAVVNRNLQNLKKENLIKIKRRKILIENYNKFENYLSSYPDLFLS